MRELERRSLLAFVIFFLIAVLPYAGLRAWQLVGEPVPGFGIQPLLNVSPYDSEGKERWQYLILKCEGEPVAYAHELLAKAKAVGVGHILHYEVNRLDRIVTIAHRVRQFTTEDLVSGFVVPAGAGVTFLVVALFLLLRQSGNQQALLFAYACASIGAFLVLYFDFNLENKLLWLSFGPYAAMSGAFFSFAQVFPFPSRPRLPWHPRAPLALSAVGGLILIGTWYGLPHEPGSVGYGLLHLQLFSYTLCIAISLLALVVLPLVRFRHAKALERQQVALMLFGAFMAFTPFAVGWVIPEVLWETHLVPLSIGVLSAGTFPLYVAYGIVRHQLFDVQVIIKRSVTYLLVFGILSALYYALLTAVGLLVLDAERSNLLATLIIACAFQPLRLRLQRVVDRLFFREAYDVQCAVEEAAAALTAILDLDEVLARLESTITGTMHPEAMATLLFVPEADAYVVARAYGDLMFPNLGRHTALIAEVQANRHVLSRALLATAKRHTVSGNLQAAQAELLVPLFFQDRLIGVLLLDQKKSHTPYNETDLTLLGTLAGQAALAIENAQKHRVIQQLNESLEERIQQRTQDLEAALATLRQTQVQLLHNEKMAAIGILAGGMAHEINNPTTIVHGHLELLADYLADLALVWETYDLAELSPESAAAIAAVKARCGYAELQTRVPEMIKAALSGTRRIREIVADLRTFSADINRDVVPADKLVEGLTATVNLVQSLFKGYRPIETRIATLPAVTVNAGQINQVISNLLINAKQASGPEGHVSLHAGIVDGEMVVTVCDDGIGIPVEIQPQIFDPFFTTKGIGEGMGLGLSISYALVKAHGGRIEVDSAPGAGATFRVCLPISLPTAKASTASTAR